MWVSGTPGLSLRNDSSAASASGRKKPPSQSTEIAMCTTGGAFWPDPDGSDLPHAPTAAATATSRAARANRSVPDG